MGVGSIILVSDDASGLKATLGNFSQDDASLPAEHKTFLSGRIVPLLKGNADRRLWLVGRAGSTERRGAEVGTARANAVATFLLCQGIDGAQLGAESGQVSAGASDASARAVDVALLPPTRPVQRGSMSEVAPEQERQDALNALHDASVAATELIRLHEDWLSNNIMEFITITSQAPRGWEVPVARQLAAYGAGAIVSWAVKKYVGPVLTELGTTFGLPGLAIAAGIYLLKQAFTKRIDALIGVEKPLTDAEKAAQVRAALLETWTKLMEPVRKAREQNLKKEDDHYQGLQKLLNPAPCSRAAAKSIKTWADADKVWSDQMLMRWAGIDSIPSDEDREDAKATARTDRSILPRMIMTWLGDHSNGPTDPALGTDDVGWKNACKKVFGDGAQGIPADVYWAMQVYAEWSRFGLSTEEAEQWIVSGSPPPEFRKGGTVVFDTALDSMALCAAAGVDPESDVAKRLEQDPSGCRVTCDFLVAQHPNYFYRYTKSAQYHLEVGRDVFPFSGGTRQG